MTISEIMRGLSKFRTPYSTKNGLGMGYFTAKEVDTYLFSSLTRLLDELEQEVGKKKEINYYTKQCDIEWGRAQGYNTKTNEVLSAIARIRGGKSE